jgi:hypothetical protein
MEAVTASTGDGVDGPADGGEIAASCGVSNNEADAPALATAVGLLEGAMLALRSADAAAPQLTAAMNASHFRTPTRCLVMMGDT